MNVCELMNDWFVSRPNACLLTSGISTSISWLYSVSHVLFNKTVSLSIYSVNQSLRKNRTIFAGQNTWKGLISDWSEQIQTKIGIFLLWRMQNSSTQGYIYYQFAHTLVWAELIISILHGKSFGQETSEIWSYKKEILPKWRRIMTSLSSQVYCIGFKSDLNNASHPVVIIQWFF